MSVLSETSTPVPTADSPAFAEIGANGVVLSKVAYWHEDGDHVIRSTEFDVIAGHADLDEAIRRFVVNTLGYAALLAQSEDRTEDDLATVLLIYQRAADFMREIEENQRPLRRRRLLRFGRRGGYGPRTKRGWRLQHVAQH